MTRTQSAALSGGGCHDNGDSTQYRRTSSGWRARRCRPHHSAQSSAIHGQAFRSHSAGSATASATVLSARRSKDHGGIVPASRSRRGGGCDQHGRDRPRCTLGGFVGGAEHHGNVVLDDGNGRPAETGVVPAVLTCGQGLAAARQQLIEEWAGRPPGDRPSVPAGDAVQELADGGDGVLSARIDESVPISAAPPPPSVHRSRSVPWCRGRG